MATIHALLNEATEFSGGADVLRCKLIGNCRNGVQIQADGVTLEDAVVKVRSRGSQEWQTVALLEGSGPNAVVGDGFYLDEVEVSGVDAGDWQFTFRQ